jgi:sulfide:quinone oxidoreductase
MTSPYEEVAAGCDITRRRMLFGASTLPLAAGALTLVSPVEARAAIRTSAHIVIAGSGLGGLAIANRLSRELDGAKITLIDRKEMHNYQPGYTLVATGIWPVDKVIDRNADLLPGKVEWIKDMATGFDPDASTVITEGGQRIRYDFLVVATGLHLDFAQIEGMDVSAVGANGMTSVYPGHMAAQATWAGDGCLPPQGWRGTDDLAGDAAQVRRRAAEDDLHAGGPPARGGHARRVEGEFPFGAGQHLQREAGQ